MRIYACVCAQIWPSVGCWLNALVCVYVSGKMWLLDGWLNKSMNGWLEVKMCVCVFAYMLVYIMKSKMIPKLMISHPHMQHYTFISVILCVVSSI